MTWTILHEACQNERTTQVIERSSINPTEATMTDDHGWTPLHIACLSNPPVDVVQALIQANPSSLQQKDVHGNYPLHIAAANAKTSGELIKCLLNANPCSAAYTNKEGMMPLHVACQFASENEILVRLLIDACPEALRMHTKIGYPAPRHQPNTTHAIVDGVLRVGMSIVELRFQLLDRQVRDGSYPLHIACMSRDTTIPVMQLLVEGAPNVLAWTNKYGETPLHVALAFGGAEDTIMLLLVQDTNNVALTMAEMNDGNLPLHIASKCGYSLDVISAMTERYPESCHVKNFMGKTPGDFANKAI